MPKLGLAQMKQERFGAGEVQVGIRLRGDPADGTAHELHFDSRLCRRQWQRQDEASQRYPNIAEHVVLH